VNGTQSDPWVDRRAINHYADPKLCCRRIGPLSGSIPENRWYGHKPGPSRQAGTAILEWLLAQVHTKPGIVLKFCCAAAFDVKTLRHRFPSKLNQKAQTLVRSPYE
jgi:hypothetical protein